MKGERKDVMREDTDSDQSASFKDVSSPRTPSARGALSPRNGDENVTPGTPSERRGSRRAAPKSHRRGRPRADTIDILMKQGCTSPSSIKCTFCNRVFPREKSLQAHLRTHTGKGELARAEKARETKELGLFCFLWAERTGACLRNILGAR